MDILENLRFKDISRLLIKEYEAGTSRKICDRAHNGFVFCYKGQLRYSMNGKEHICNPQNVVLAPKGCTYDFVVEKDSKTFGIDFELNEGTFEEMQSYFVNESESYWHDYHNMQKRVFGVGSYKLTNLSDLYNIVARVNNSGYYVKKYVIMEAAEKYLEENLCKGSLSIQEIADQSNISEVYFRRLFKEKHGVSPMQYININRLKNAKNLLVEDELSISEISLVCGFLDVYSFSRAFKKWVGISPSEYRKRMQFRNC